MTYILILTIFMNHSQGGSAITTVEMTSRQSCLDAAVVWLKESQKHDYSANSTAVCVRK